MAIAIVTTLNTVLAVTIDPGGLRWTSGRPPFAGVDEQGHGEEIGRPAWTEPARNEAPVH
jgi:hypothetical protein